MAMKKDLLGMMDVKDEIFVLLERAKEIKAWQKKGQPHELLRGKTLGMIFEKASTRTRLSFEVGMTQLGGHAIYLSPKDMQMGRGETIADTGRVLSRFVDAIVYRAFDHKMVAELAANSSVPVINALDDKEHPCQIMADILTIMEHKGDPSKLKFAYVGDGNNVCNSLLLGCAMVGMNISVGCPEGYDPNGDILHQAKHLAGSMGSTVEMTRFPQKAVEYADVIYTDVWVSMGDEATAAKREKDLLPFQVNEALVASAKGDCIVMHCLPAHRGLEITDQVIDGQQSVVFDQAENRLHAQKAILERLIPQ